MAMPRFDGRAIVPEFGNSIWHRSETASMSVMSYPLDSDLRLGKRRVTAWKFL
jgi:hypothetical protein